MVAGVGTLLRRLEQLSRRGHRLHEAAASRVCRRRRHKSLRAPATAAAQLVRIPSLPAGADPIPSPLLLPPTTSCCRRSLPPASALLFPHTPPLPLAFMIRDIQIGFILDRVPGGYFG